MIIYLNIQKNHTVCPRSLDQFYKVTYNNMKQGKTSWTYSILVDFLYLIAYSRVEIRDTEGISIGLFLPSLVRGVICGAWPVSLMICSLPAHARVRDAGLSHSRHNCIWYKVNKYVYYCVYMNIKLILMILPYDILQCNEIPLQGRQRRRGIGIKIKKFTLYGSGANNTDRDHFENNLN